MKAEMVIAIGLVALAITSVFANTERDKIAAQNRLEQCVIEHNIVWQRECKR